MKKNRFRIHIKDGEHVFVGVCNYRDMSIERQCRIDFSLLKRYRATHYSRIISLSKINICLLQLNPLVVIDEMQDYGRYVLDSTKRYRFEEMDFFEYNKL